MYSPKPEFVMSQSDWTAALGLNYKDPISRHQVSYLNGGGGSGKTTRAIKLFKDCKPLMLTPTHKLAKEGRLQGVKSQTYHSFFKWSGGRRAKATDEDLKCLNGNIVVWKAKSDWSSNSEVLMRTGDSTPDKEFVARKLGDILHYVGFKNSGPYLSDMNWTSERLGPRPIPRVVIWDEICTVPLEILVLFLDFLKSRGVQVICCGDQDQPPPIGGESPHDWLVLNVDYYEHVSRDYRAQCLELKCLKQKIRLQPDKVQYSEMIKAISSCAPWSVFIKKMETRGSYPYQSKKGPGLNPGHALQNS